MSLGPREQRLCWVKAKEPLIFRTITDPENVRSFGGEGWNNSSQRSLWSSPELPLPSQRNWSLPQSESGTERETERKHKCFFFFFVKQKAKTVWFDQLHWIFCQLNMVRSKIIHECSSLSLATITFFLGQPALCFPHHLADFMLL